MMTEGPLKGEAFDGSKSSFGMGSPVTTSFLKDGSRVSTALHHSIHLPEPSSYFPSVMTAGSAAATTASTLMGDARNTPLSLPVAVMSTRTAPPTLASGAGTPPGDMAYRGQQQVISEWLLWMTETQAATAILG